MRRASGSFVREHPASVLLLLVSIISFAVSHLSMLLGRPSQ